MQKIYYISVLVLCNVSLVHAIDSTPTTNLSGLAIGIEAVWNQYNTKHISDYNYFSSITTTSLVFHREHKNSISALHKKHATGIGINIGYYLFYNNWYLGLVGDLSITSPLESQCEGRLAPHLKSSGFMYGIKAKPGYYFRPINTVVYGIIGITWNQITLSISHPRAEPGATQAKNPMFVYGMGCETPIHHKLSFYAEYVHSCRRSSSELNLKLKRLPIDIKYQIYDIEHKMSINSVKLGFKLYF